MKNCHIFGRIKINNPITLTNFKQLEKTTLYSARS